MQNSSDLGHIELNFRIFWDFFLFFVKKIKNCTKIVQILPWIPQLVKLFPSERSGMIKNIDPWLEVRTANLLCTSLSPLSGQVH